MTFNLIFQENNTKESRHESIGIISDGIGACSSALNRLKIDYEIADYVEIDKYAVASYNAIHGTNFEPQDITKWDKDLDVDFIMHGSPCFVAGTKVLTKNGYKNIEDIVVGDEVLTHKNRYKKVLKVGHSENKEVYQLKAQGIFDTFVTPNHPYYVREMSRINSNHRHIRTWKEPTWKEVKDLKKDDFIGINIPTTEENPFNIDKETCWLLGRYVADGHIRHSKRLHRKNSYQYGVIFSLGNVKVNDFKKHLHNFHASIYPHTTSCYRAVINSRDFVQFIEENGFGKGAINKNIPNFVLNLPKELAKEFLDGYISGDGCCTNNKYKATSISQDLILKLQLLIAKVYNTSSNVNCCKRVKKTIIENRIVNQHDSYNIDFQKEIKKQNHSFVDIENNIIWYPVKAVIKANQIGTVYNLEVESDNSYTANNAIVHNCQDFSAPGDNKGGGQRQWHKVLFNV